MGKDVLTFGKMKLKIINFTIIKVQFFFKKIDIEKVLVSSKVSSGEKTINTLLVNELKVKPLFIMLPKRSPL